MSWDKETPKEREKRLRRVFHSSESKYNYQLNVSNKAIQAFYLECIRLGDIKAPPGDKWRIKFEAALWKFLRLLFHKWDTMNCGKLPAYSEGLRKELFGWRLEQLEIFINDVLNVDEAIPMFIKRWNKICAEDLEI